jgi:tRNA threonylcarbamoyladenosine biosynthesis protein TsaE
MPILRDNTLEIQSRTLEQTLRIGQRLGELLTLGDVICLNGSMGAGKTTFARGVGQGWGSTSPLNSPTFTLINVHRRRQDNQRLYHVDAYRLETPESVASVGLEEIFEGDGAVLIEWALRLGSLLPTEHLWVEFAADESAPDRRIITVQSKGERYDTLLKTWRQAIFGDKHA